ncbi:MAG: dihydroneopterin aldolase [Peptococcaceae bacterium]|nr:dihydroneopterin aldolase [Peptococcaceae bacterium]
MDKIVMKGMKFFGYHGVLAWEKELGQIFEVDLEVELDLEAAGRKDDLKYTVSYAELFAMVEEVFTGYSFDLIEAVAHTIASRIINKYLQIERIKVAIKKPSAPITGIFDYMGVEITREKLKN